MEKVIEDIFWNLMINILRELHEHHHDLPFSTEIIKIKKVEKLVANLHNKNKYVIHIRYVKQANHGLVF